MKKIICLLSLLTLLLTACHNEDEPTPNKKVDMGRRTVLVYMVAQNTLGGNSQHLKDSLEIINGRSYINASDRMLMFIDAGGKPTLYRVSADALEPEVIMQWDKDFCSADPARLQEVLDTVKSRCPSQEYGLVMWSHSDGWISPTNTNYSQYESTAKLPKVSANTLSFGIDSGSGKNYTNSGAQMSVSGIASAINGANLHMAYIFFDSCLMGSIEVAYALRNVTDYVVASPVSTPGAGSYYTHDIEYGLFSDDPSDICAIYISDVQSEELKSSYNGIGLAISCVRTDKLEALASAVKEALPYSSLMGRTSVDMDTVLAYQAYYSEYYYRPHNYDALQALHHILPATYFAQVKTVLQSAVVYYDATESVWIGPGFSTYIYPPLETGNFCCLSMFIPQAIYTTNSPNTRHGDLNEDFQKTEWYKAAGFTQTGW